MLLYIDYEKSIDMKSYYTYLTKAAPKKT